jgi:hypothetical protein
MAKIEGERPPQTTIGMDRRSLLRGMGVVAAASAFATVGPGHAEAVGPWGGHANGRIPLSALVAIPWATSLYLRADACEALTALNSAFRARFLGRNIGVTDAYRDYETQVRLKAQKGAFAATPGTSNHGWALATDLASSINSFGTPEHEWMRANAPAYGWVHPVWAHDNNPDNGQQEPWHWEFIGGGDAPSTGPDPDPLTEEEDMLHTVIICDLTSGTEYGSTAVIDPINGFTRTSTGLGPRDELNARTAIANALGFPVVEKHVDQNGWVMAMQRYTR